LIITLFLIACENNQKQINMKEDTEVIGTDSVTAWAELEKERSFLKVEYGYGGMKIDTVFFNEELQLGAYQFNVDCYGPKCYYIIDNISNELYMVDPYWDSEHSEHRITDVLDDDFSKLQSMVINYGYELMPINNGFVDFERLINSRCYMNKPLPNKIIRKMLSQMFNKDTIGDADIAHIKKHIEGVQFNNENIFIYKGKTLKSKEKILNTYDYVEIRLAFRTRHHKTYRVIFWELQTLTDL